MQKSEFPDTGQGIHSEELLISLKDITSQE